MQRDPLQRRCAIKLAIASAFDGGGLSVLMRVVSTVLTARVLMIAMFAFSVHALGDCHRYGQARNERNDAQYRTNARAYVFICVVNPIRLAQAQAMNGQRFTSTMPTALDTSIASAFLRLASVDALALVFGSKLLGWGMLVATLLV